MKKQEYRRTEIFDAFTFYLSSLCYFLFYLSLVSFYGTFRDFFFLFYRNKSLTI